MKIAFVIGCLIMSGFSYAADDYKSIALEAKQRESAMIAPYLDEAQKASERGQKIKMTYLSDSMNAQHNSMTQVSESMQSGLSHPKSFQQVVVFVSFSLPTQSLIAYIRDAQKIHASIVIRGLIHNSFKETFLRTGEIVKAAGGGGLELNPPLFKKLGITHVPMVAVFPDNSQCLSKNTCSSQTDYDVISGDISLPAALKEIRDRGTIASKTAEKMLLLLQGTSHG